VATSRCSAARHRRVGFASSVVHSPMTDSATGGRRHRRRTRPRVNPSGDESVSERDQGVMGEVQRSLNTSMGGTRRGRPSGWEAGGRKRPGGASLVVLRARMLVCHRR
jgi:hypothetical protein